MINRFEEILSYAIINNSTDIHFEINNNKELKISIRTIYGFRDLISKNIDYKVLEYLKYTSNLNLIAESTPQSGSFMYHFNNEDYYLRCASIKSQFKEVCVLRILNKLYINDDIFSDINDEIEILLNKDYGLIIFSGPTGSGKTTSMYSLMQKYQEKKIYSIEDPIEIHFDNIVQIEINRDRNFDYKEAITQVLRHDPDLICIGEIRDENAASMAIRASFTGHLVLCTIHAASTNLTIKRLLDLGISESEIEDNVIMILNQRLIIKDNKRESYYETLTL